MDNGGQLTKRQQQRLASQEKIFQSAVELFKERGFDNVRIEDISERAGVSNGLFYNYFESKNQIIVEVFKHMDSDYDEVFRSIPATMSAPEKLLQFCSFIAVPTEKLGNDFARVLYQSFLNPDKSDVFMINEDRSLYKFLKILIEDGQQKGQITTALDAVEIRSIILHCARGVIYHWALYDGVFDLKTELRKVISALIYGLRPSSNN